MTGAGKYLPLFFVGLSALCRPSESRAQLTSHGFSAEDMAQSTEDARSYHSYPTYSQYLDIMNAFAKEYPQLCRLDTFGITPGGRLLLALNINTEGTVPDKTTKAGEPGCRARFLYTSTMHGDELVGYVLLLRLADTLLSGYRQDPEITSILDDLDIWINPLANPDGAYMAGDPESLEHARRYNSAGVDLNRDFPDPGAAEPDQSAHRAPETRDMMKFLHEHRFNLSANLHGGEEVVNYPWDHCYPRHADDAWFYFVSREYADEARAVDPSYMAGFSDGVTNGAEWYIVRGGRQDYLTYYLQGREITLELSLEKFPPANELNRFWNINYRPLINYMAQARYGVRGRVYSAGDGQALEARIYIPGHDRDSSAVFSNSKGIFHRYLSEGSYPLVASAPGYYNDTLLVHVVDHQRTEIDFELKARKVKAKSREQAPALSLYPNPAGAQLIVEGSGLPPGDALLLIISREGRILRQEHLTGPKQSISLSINDLPPGLFCLQLRYSNGVLHRKFIRR